MNTPYAVCVATSEQDAAKLQDFMHEQMGHTMPAPKPIERPQVIHIERPKYVYAVRNCDSGEVEEIYWDESEAIDSADEFTQCSMFTYYEVCTYEVK